MNNTLYFGDNLDILREYIKDETIDLIYLDPPFNSKVNYNVIFKTPKKEDSPSQIQAFEDTWKWNSTTEFELHQLFGSEPKLAELMKGLELIIGKNDLLAYLVMMAIRLRELHRVLKDTGSLYLHCDPTASHYLKLILDSIFGMSNFKNEIIWKRASSGQKGSQYESKKFGSLHDIMLFYCKNLNKTFVKIPKRKLSDEEIERRFPKEDEKGKWKDDSAHIFSTPGMGARPNLCYTWRGFKNPHPSGWRLSRDRLEEEYHKGNITIENNKVKRRVYLKDYKGENLSDVWGDIPMAAGNERMGYPTQKPILLLERIIKASSNENDIILDPFCGCGTAIVAAQRLKRNWIGMDVTHLAIGLMEKRIYDEFKIKPKVIGNPASFIGAENLFKRSPLDFERWAVTRIDGMHPNDKQVGDHGIDGRGYIGPDNQYKTIISVKGGKQLNPAMVRDLFGTVTREDAAFGVLITIHNPTDGMKKEAAKAGIVNTPLGHHYPKIQIYTISDYFNGKKAELP